MSVATKSPLKFTGGTLFSGGPNTGELSFTQGGMISATVFSGGLLSPGSGKLPSGTVKTADQLLLWSGAGRVNRILCITPISGIITYMYDSAQLARSGAPPSESGYGVVGLIPANSFNPAGTLQPIIGPQEFGIPFSSGLCLNCVSGTPGFTVTFTPEVVGPLNP